VLVEDNDAVGVFVAVLDVVRLAGAPFERHHMCWVPLTVAETQYFDELADEFVAFIRVKELLGHDSSAVAAVPVSATEPRF